MIKYCSFLLIFILSFSCSKESCSSEKKEASECLGDILWNCLREESVEYDLETVLRTIRNNHMGDRKSFENPSYQLSKIAEKSDEKKASLQLERANKYLSKLFHQEGVLALKNKKVMYRIIKPGKGAVISESSTPLMHFREKDLDGEVLFDTYISNKPLRISLDETIQGFKLGVSGMRVGEHREIVVHPDLAYKKLGKTKPYQLLVYEVTILEE